MWVMTTGGYVSAVQHRDNPALVMVRARDHASLADLCKQLELDAGKAIYSDFPSDYPYRVVITKEQFATFLVTEVTERLDYTNFKSAAKKVRGEKYARFLMSVWSVSHSLTPERIKRKNDAARPSYSTRYTSAGSLGWGSYRAPDDRSRDFNSVWEASRQDRDAFPGDEAFGEASEHAGVLSVHSMTDEQWKQHELGLDDAEWGALAETVPDANGA